LQRFNALLPGLACALPFLLGLRFGGKAWSGCLGQQGARMV